jgi:dihydroflavonol-4-reductase
MSTSSSSSSSPSSTTSSSSPTFSSSSSPFTYPPITILSSLSPCNVLITGASGFIGSYLTRTLFSLGHTIYILCRKSSDLSSLTGINYIKCIGDITDPLSVLSACRDIDTVFHCAAYIGYTLSERSIMESINIDGTYNIINACIEQKVRRLMYCSSIVTIGANKYASDPLLNEESIYNMNEFNLGYYHTKYKAEQLIKQYIISHNLNAVILNLSNVYGYGDALKSSRSTQIKASQGKLPFYTYGGINIISINDVIISFIKAWEIAPSGSSYIIVN